MATEVSVAQYCKTKPVQVAKLVKWIPSDPGSFTLNTDGSFKERTKCSSASRLIRNSNGDWLGGFAINIGLTHSPMAELWVICEGLVLGKKFSTFFSGRRNRCKVGGSVPIQ